MGYQYEMEATVEEAMNGFAAMTSSLTGISSILNLAAYVFTALALYTIANRRGIRKAWLAWIPVVDVWILGSISDQFRYVVKGEEKSKRKILLTLSLIEMAAGIVVVIMTIVMAVNAIITASQYGSEEAVIQQIMGSVFGLVGVVLILLVLSIVKVIFYYMALYDLYTSCEPRNNTLYLVLSIIPMVSAVALPLLLFLVREKDEGMPPRRPEPIPEYSAPVDWQQDAQQGKQEWYEVQSEPSEPWNNPEE